MKLNNQWKAKRRRQSLNSLQPLSWNIWEVLELDAGEVRRNKWLNGGDRDKVTEMHSDEQRELGQGKNGSDVTRTNNRQVLEAGEGTDVVNVDIIKVAFLEDESGEMDEAIETVFERMDPVKVERDETSHGSDSREVNGLKGETMKTESDEIGRLNEKRRREGVSRLVKQFPPATSWKRTTRRGCVLVSNRVKQSLVIQVQVTEVRSQNGRRLADRDSGAAIEEDVNGAPPYGIQCNATGGDADTGVEWQLQHASPLHGNSMERTVAAEVKVTRDQAEQNTRERVELWAPHSNGRCWSVSLDALLLGVH